MTDSLQEDVMPVAVPKLIGLSRPDAEAALDALLLRHIAQFPFDAAGDGTARSQNPAPMTLVPAYSVVTVAYPSPLGPMEDSPVMGPALPAGRYEGRIDGVTVGNPWGAVQGAWIDFTTDIEGAPLTFTGALYVDHTVHPGPPPARTESMRRSAMLGLAQRAFSNSHKVSVITTREMYIQAIQLIRS